MGLDWEKFSDELKEKFEDRGDYLVNTRLEQEREKRFKRDGLDIIKDKYALIDHLEPYSDELVKEVAVPNVSAQAAFDDLFE